MVLGKLKGCSFATAEAARQSKVYIKTQDLGSQSNYVSETVCGTTTRSYSSWAGSRITHLRFFDESSPSNIKEAVYNAATGQIEISGESIVQQPEQSESEEQPEQSPPYARDPAFDFDTLQDAGNTSPRGIWSDGTTMWVADETDGWGIDKIYAYNMPANGDTPDAAAPYARAPDNDFNTLIAAGNENPSGLWSDGTTLWVAAWTDDKIFAYNLFTKARDPDNDFNTLIAAGNENPSGLWSDGTTLWVTDNYYDRIYAYRMPSQPAAKAQALIGLPEKTQLQQNAPNPFNSETVLSYFLLEPGPARLEVFSMIGQRVAVLRQGHQQAGYHRLRWNGRDDAGRPLASGIYLYRLVTDEGILTRKLVLLR